MISLEGLSKADVLAALYNASRPQGMGFLHYDPAPMTGEQAAVLLKEDTYFDYLKGRVMKVNLGNENLDARLYDRDNGDGAAERAIAALRNGGGVAAPEIAAAHQAGTLAAAEIVRDMMNTPTTKTVSGVGHVLTLGLDDVKDTLAPAVDSAVAKSIGH